MARTILDIPADLDQGEFLPILNDRLRQISDAISRAGGSTTIIRTGSGGGGAGVSPPAANGYHLDSIAADQVQIDLGNGIRHRVVLNQVNQVTILTPVFTGGTIAPGLSFILYVDQDATGGRVTPAFDGAGFISDTGSPRLDATASTRSIYQFTYHANSLWGVDSFITGKAIT